MVILYGDDLRLSNVTFPKVMHNDSLLETAAHFSGLLISLLIMKVPGARAVE